METFVILDDDSIEITLSSPLISAEIQGTMLLVGDIVVDKLSTKTPLSESSTYLIVQMTAEEPVLEFDLVYVSATGGIRVATNNGTGAEAFVLGMVLADTSVGLKADVLILGVIKDPLFSTLALNKAVYLDVTGGLTDEVPTILGGAQYSTPIGRALGGGAVLINISNPLKLS